MLLISFIWLKNTAIWEKHSYPYINLCYSLRWVVHNFIQLWVFTGLKKKRASIFTWLLTFTLSEFLLSLNASIRTNIILSNICIASVKSSLELYLTVVSKIPSNWVFWTRGIMAQVLRASSPHVWSLPSYLRWLFPWCWHYELCEKCPLVQTA